MLISLSFKTALSMSKRKVFVVGLVGGIASGKSFVAQLFAEYGAPIIDADKIGHEVLKRPLIVRRLGQVFGAQVVDENGSIDRKALGQLVFGDSSAARQKREQLEAIVHPVIHAEAVQQLARLSAGTPAPAAVVIDAPLLLEAGWAPMCDIIVFVDTPTSIRSERAEQRGWSSAHFAQREQAQMPLNDKRAQATHILNGNAHEAELRSAIQLLMEEMVI